MIIVATRSAKQLVDNMHIPQANYIIKQFSDGEIYVKINQDVQAQEVWVVAATQPPAEHVLELFFLLDALTRAGAKKINIFFTYFGYARQAVALSGEACSAQFICDVLQKFSLGRVYIMHAHAADILHTFLPFNNAIDISFFCSVAQQYDIIAAPDKGAVAFAKEVAQRCNKEIIFFHKMRPEHERVTIKSVDGIATGKSVLLVDDIISTGSTMIEAAQALKKLGATHVAAAATHGIFSPGAFERLAASTLEKMYVTNTIMHAPHEKIEVVDVSAFVESIIRTAQ